MSQPREEREFKVVITVSDEMGNELSRNFKYSPYTNYTEQVEEIIETHIEAEDL